MPIPYRKQKPVRLREMFNSDYQLITILPAYSESIMSAHYFQDLDDVIFARYKDILVDPERYLATLNSWFYDHIRDFDNIYKALVQEYDPLSNYDMIEKEGSVSKEGEKVSESKRYGSEKTTQTIPDTKDSRYTTTYDQATLGRLDSYNVTEIQSAPQLEGHNAQITVSEQLPDIAGKQGSELTEKFKGDVSITAPESTLEGDRGSERELTRKGNIGVTTSQQMLQSEVELRVKHSFIDIFCKMFARDMTLGVWDLEGV